MAALLALSGMDALLSKLSVGLIITLGLMAVAAYLAIVIVYAVITSHIYNKKHRDARQRVKRYNHNLTRLLKMYEKENR